MSAAILFHVATLLVGSTLLSLVYEGIVGSERFSLPFSNILLVTAVGTVLSVWWGWTSTSWTLAAYAVFCIAAGLTDRTAPIPDATGNTGGDSGHEAAEWVRRQPSDTEILAGLRQGASPLGYPDFHMPSEVEFWGAAVWRRMIEAIDPAYFERTGRLPHGSVVRGARVVDAIAIHSAGDEWVLAMVDLELADSETNRLFLPLVRTIIPTSDPVHWMPMQSKLEKSPELIAFGVRTESGFAGARPWVVYDALPDGGIMLVLPRLLWGEQSFYHLEVSEGEYGELGFRLAQEIAVPDIEEATLAFDDDKNATVSFDGFRMSIPRDLRSIDALSVERRAGVVGWIEYRNRDDEMTVLGVLQRTD